MDLDSVTHCSHLLAHKHKYKNGTMYIRSYFHILLMNKIVIVLNNSITFYYFFPGNGCVAVSAAVGAAVGGLIGGFIGGVVLTAVIAGMVFYRAKRKFTAKIE